MNKNNIIIRTTFLLMPIFWALSAFATDAGATEPTPDEYWQRIRKTAASEFGGMDMEVKFTPRYNFEGEEKGVGISFDIPLYSKQQRIARRKEADVFLSRGAELIKELEVAIQAAKLSQDTLPWLMKKKDIGGLDAVIAYNEMAIKIAEHKATIRQKRREIESLINPYFGRPVVNSETQPVKYKEKL